MLYMVAQSRVKPLFEHCLHTEDYIIIQCFNRWELADIHSAILKQTGYQITQSVKKTVSGKKIRFWLP